MSRVKPTKDWLLDRLVDELEKSDATASTRAKLLELIGKHQDVQGFEKTQVNIDLGSLVDRLVRGRGRVIEASREPMPIGYDEPGDLDGAE